MFQGKASEVMSRKRGVGKQWEVVGSLNPNQKPRALNHNPCGAETLDVRVLGFCRVIVGWALGKVTCAPQVP